MYSGVLFALLLLAGSLMLVPVARVLAQDATPEASPVSARSGTFDGLVDIGGRSLHLDALGEGSPTVILEAGGYGTPSDVWGAVMPQVAASRASVATIGPTINRVGATRHRRCAPPPISWPTCMPCWRPPTFPVPTSSRPVGRWVVRPALCRDLSR